MTSEFPKPYIVEYEATGADEVPVLGKESVLAFTIQEAVASIAIRTSGRHQKITRVVNVEPDLDRVREMGKDIARAVIDAVKANRPPKTSH